MSLNVGIPYHEVILHYLVMNKHVLLIHYHGLHIHKLYKRHIITLHINYHFIINNLIIDNQYLMQQRIWVQLYQVQIIQWLIMNVKIYIIIFLLDWLMGFNFWKKGFGLDLNLTVNSDMDTIVRAMAEPDSGLDIRDRIWLKIPIPKSFLG